jgi:hypothetical protein
MDAVRTDNGIPREQAAEARGELALRLAEEPHPKHHAADYAQPQQSRALPAPTQGRGGSGPALHNMPSYGFYVRHVKGIQFDNIEIRTDKDDLRPTFVLDGVADADFFRIKVPDVADVPTFALHDVSGLSIHMCSGIADQQLKSFESATL